MSWSKFTFFFVLVILLTFSKYQWAGDWLDIEFSYFLIFMIVRSSRLVRALIFTFIISLGLDIIFQAQQVKGLAAMSQMLMVFILAHLKKHVIPEYEDLFLLGSFAIFYFADYYMNLLLGTLLGLYVQYINFGMVLFLAILHAALFGFLLVLDNKLNRGGK